MTRVNQGDTIRCVVRWRMTNGDIANNALHYFINQVPTAVDDAAFATDIGSLLAAAYDGYKAEISDEVTIEDVLVYVFNAVTGLWDNVGIGPINVTGTQTGASYPDGNAKLVSLRTANTRVKGRSYLPNLNLGNATDDGEVGVNDLLGIVALYSDLLLLLSTVSGNAAMVVWSKKLSQAFTVTNVIANAVVAYQRRRRKGRGS